MSEPHDQQPHQQSGEQPHLQSGEQPPQQSPEQSPQQPPQEPTLSLDELETEIAQAEILIQDLNQRLQQTAEDR